MKRVAWKAALALACAALCAPAGAQTMYKCGKQYQDRPCDAGQAARAAGGSASSATVVAGGDAECAQRGSDALKVAWSREGGATAEKLSAEIDAKNISSSRRAEEKKLVQDVYQKRGSAPQIRAAIEADCLAEKERAAQAAALAAAAARLQGNAPPPAAEAAAGATEAKTLQEASVAGAGAPNKSVCASLASNLAANRASQRGGGSPAAMEKLKEAERRIQAQAREAGC